jgi:hypothetical protein
MFVPVTVSKIHYSSWPKWFTIALYFGCRLCTKPPLNHGFMFTFTRLSVAKTIQCRMADLLDDNGLERMWTGKRRGLIRGAIPVFAWGDLWQTTKKPNQYGRSPGRYLNQGPSNKKQYAQFYSEDPCGGGVEYLHRDPASRGRRRKGKSQMWDSKIWSQVPRDSDPRKSALARASSIYKGQTRPLVREGAAQEQDRNCLTCNKDLVVSPRWVLCSKTDWPADRRS